VWWWWPLAAAAELEVLGFGSAGRIVSAVELEPVEAGWSARLLTIDVAEGTWNHLPAAASGPTREAAVAAACASVEPAYTACAASRERVPAALAWWSEGSRDHSHAAEHVVHYRVRASRGVVPLTLSERPEPGACEGAIQPSLRTDAGRDLLADQRPRRWPRCALSFELEAVWEDRGGGLLLALRVVELGEGEQLRVRHLLTAMPAGGGR
jgi:hypothetical protein